MFFKPAFAVCFALSCLVTGAAAQNNPQAGITVFQPTNSTTAYAVDLLGNVEHTWPGTVTPGLGVYMAPNGDLVRSLGIANGPGAGGRGGAIERVTWDGQVLWSFAYTSSTFHSHHDIALMPNGNVLMIAWDSMGGAGAIAEGRNPSSVGSAFWSDHIIEVEPDGNGGASVVWEWYAKDHLVQDFNPSLPNFDAPEDRPERININFPNVNTGTTGDWLHCNGIGYNAELDQIVLSSRTFNEIWVIDHSTTTAEAAGSTGGLRGKGGDLLYRWGNPVAYGRGIAADRTLFGQHDCQWIPEGRPGAGNLLVFNNGVGRPGNYSSADEISPPINANGTYDLVGTGAYGPAAATWSGTHPNPSSFFSPTTSGCQRQPNGNTVMAAGSTGALIEITMTGTLVWSYQIPFPNAGANNRVFKVQRHAGGVTGLAYCDPAVPNSTGSPATLAAVGSNVATENSLVLHAAGLPTGEFGFFLNGTGSTVTPMAGGSAGDLCLSDSIGRYNALPQIFNAGPQGVGSLELDLMNTPTPLGNVSILAGQTWYFQCWYRDTPAMTANFTNGVEVTFL